MGPAAGVDRQRGRGAGRELRAEPVGRHGPLCAEAGVGLPLAALITWAILFGTDVQSERAFRLLRWLGDRPEHPAPNAGKDNTGEDVTARR